MYNLLYVGNTVSQENIHTAIFYNLALCDLAFADILRHLYYVFVFNFRTSDIIDLSFFPGTVIRTRIQAQETTFHTVVIKGK